MELKNLTLEELIQIQKEYKKTLRSIEGRILRIKSYNSLKHSKPQKPVKRVKAISSRRAKSRFNEKVEYKKNHLDKNGYFVCAVCGRSGTDSTYFQASHFFAEGQGGSFVGYSRNTDMIIKCAPCHNKYEILSKQDKIEFLKNISPEIRSRVEKILEANKRRERGR